MSKLKECSMCGEWFEMEAPWVELCDACRFLRLKSYQNHRRLWSKFFDETREMVLAHTGKDLMDSMPLPFAVRK